MMQFWSRQLLQIACLSVFMCGAQFADAGLIRRGSASNNASPPPPPGTPYFALIDQSSPGYGVGDFIFDSSDILPSGALFDLEALPAGNPTSYPGILECGPIGIFCSWEFGPGEQPKFRGYALNQLRFPTDPVFHWEVRTPGGAGTSRTLYRWEQGSDPAGMVMGILDGGGTYTARWELMFTPQQPLQLDPGLYELWLLTTLSPPPDVELATIADPLACFEDAPPLPCGQNPLEVVNQLFPGDVTFGSFLPLRIAVPQPATAWLMLPVLLLFARVSSRAVRRSPDRRRVQ